MVGGFKGISGPGQEYSYHKPTIFLGFPALGCLEPKASDEDSEHRLRMPGERPGTYIHIQTPTYIHACIHTYADIYIYICINIHIYI